MKSLLTKCLDFLFFIAGPFIVVFNLLSFSSRRGSLDGPAVYFYSEVAKIGVCLGVALICFGFLRKYWNRK